MPDPIITVESSPDDDDHNNIVPTFELDDDDEEGREGDSDKDGDQESRPLQSSFIIRQRDLAEGHSFDTGQANRKREKKR